MKYLNYILIKQIVVQHALLDSVIVRFSLTEEICFNYYTPGVTKEKVCESLFDTHSASLFTHSFASLVVKYKEHLGSFTLPAPPLCVVSKVIYLNQLTTKRLQYKIIVRYN